jgi:hypothetical protein
MVHGASVAAVAMFVAACATGGPPAHL